MRLAAIVILAAAAALLPAPAGNLLAQGSAGGRDTASREVTKLSFVGNHVLGDRELRNFIETEATRCKSLLIYPACWLTPWSFFEIRNEINVLEIGRDMVRLRAQYYLRGYRAATADTIIQRLADGDVRVTFVINEGEPTRIATLAVNRPPGILSDARVNELVRLRAGDPLSLIELDTARALLSNALWEQGYSDAIIRVDTSTTGLAANVAINIDPRWVSRVAAIQVAGNAKISARTITNSMFFEIGEPFRLSEMERSQRALYESGLFTRAEVHVAGDSNKTIIVDVDEAKLRQTRLGGGVSTLEFFQVEGQFTNFNWMGGARRVSLNLAVGNLLAPQLNGKAIFRNALEGIDASGGTYLSPTWRTSADLRIPWFRNARNEVSLSAFAQRRSVPGIFVDRSGGFSAVFTREVADRIPISFGYQFELTRVDAGDLYFCVNFGVCDPPTIAALRSTRSISPFSLSTTIDRTNDPLSATQGYNLRASYEHASSFTLSEYRYNRVMTDAAWYLPAMKNSVLALHLRAGWVGAIASTDDALGVDAEGRSILHPRKKFYAGGSQSVRGFGEAQLGPRILTIPRDDLITAGCTVDATGAVCDQQILNDRVLLADSLFAARPLGGNLLAETSVELRVPLVKSLVGAIFVDAALVGERELSNLRQATFAVTPGFGIRYASMAGPIRIDLGYNPFLTEDLPVVTNVDNNGVNQIAAVQMIRSSDMQLVPGQRTFTPQRSRGVLGFLTKFTLHLSIGEAF